MAFPYPPKKINLEIEQGTTFKFSQGVFDTTTNLPLDLTGFSGELVVKEFYAQTETLSGIPVECGPWGVRFELGVDVTTPTTWNRGWYKLQVTDTLYNVTTLFEGLVLVQ